MGVGVSLDKKRMYYSHPHSEIIDLIISVRQLLKEKRIKINRRARTVFKR
jgi:hypothetical protein